MNLQTIKPISRMIWAPYSNFKFEAKFPLLRTDYDVTMLRAALLSSIRELDTRKSPLNARKTVKKNKIRRLRTVLRTARELLAKFANCSRAKKKPWFSKKVGIRRSRTGSSRSVREQFANFYESPNTANLEYEPNDMRKGVLHLARTLSTNTHTPFVAVMVLPVWEDTPRSSACIWSLNNMKTLIHVPSATCDSSRRIKTRIWTL